MKPLMKDNTVTFGEWEWCIDDESRLVPWFSIYPEVEEKYAVRTTESARLFKVQDSQKRSYYVKHETPNSIREHLIAWFSSHARDLYESAEVLKNAGIPCAEYPGWGKSGTESMILSVEMSGANGVPADLGTGWAPGSIEDNGRDFVSEFVIDYVRCYQYK